MTQQLSSAAQAVALAYDNTPERPTGNHRYHWLGAALRAAADQGEIFFDAYDSPVQVVTVEDLLAIADELEAQ